MIRYIFRRILYTIPVLILVSVIVFSMVHLIPGDPARVILGPDATDAQVAVLHEKMGLDDPLVFQYFKWIKDIFTGDFGDSVATNTPVLDLIMGHFAPTLSVTLFALIIDLIISVPLGILAALKKNSPADYSVSVLSLMGVTLPDFLIALALMMFFAVFLRIFPSSGYAPLSDGLGAHLRSIALPAIALGFTYSALMMRMTKASMNDALHSDYIRFAKAKGSRRGAIVMKHALKNSSVRMFTIIGQAVVGMLSGAAVIETVFVIPGIGQLIVLSIARRDYLVIQAIVLMVTVINVVLMLVVDILYGIIDPRIRLE